MDKQKIHPDLLIALERVYLPLGLDLHSFEKEEESKEYAASNFILSGKRVKFRIGKITSVKIGQFTTFWKRSKKEPITPFDKEDPFDLLVISVRGKERLGQFIFPKQLLCEKGVVSSNGKGGKRALRIYPSWDIPENPQAKKTQNWQLSYFFEIPSHTNDNLAHVLKLLNIF